MIVEVVQVMIQDEPLDLVTNAGEAVADLVGGRLGGVRGELVADLCDCCQ